MSVLTPVSWSELIDKLTILEIKTERMSDPAKKKNVARELEALRPLQAQALEAQAGLSTLQAQLKSVNGTLWTIEDEIRDCERHQDFGGRFIELARAVYYENDGRARVKGQINELLGSDLVEEKSYQAY